MKFDILDNISLRDRSLMLILCGLSCCWGFVNNTILLVLAGKIGFPLAVSVCAISINRKQIQSVVWYTILLILVSIVYFVFNPVVIDYTLTKNYIPTITDLLLAIGLGAALSYFWNHAMRLNLIVMSAGLASLLPACIIAGYYISQAEFVPALQSIALYLQYVAGMWLGATIINYFEKSKK